MYEITNIKLAELDKKTGEFYKLSMRYLLSLDNLYGKQVYKTEFSSLMKETEGITPESEFDALILRNIKSNLALNDLTFDFFSNPAFSLSVVDFIEKLAGAGAWNYLEQKVKFPPFEKQWKHFEKQQDKLCSRVSAYIEEAQNAARACLPKIKEDVIKYGKSEGYLPQNFEMNDLLLLPPRENGQSSSWNSKTKTFSIGSYAFDFFIENGAVIAVPTLAYNTAFHEVLGHGAHQILSEKLPYSVRFTEEVGTITPTKSVTEGVAMNRQSESFAFLRAKIQDFNLKEDDILLLEEQDELNHSGICTQTYYSLIKDMEIREKGFDTYAHILNLTQNPTLARDLKNTFSDFRKTWKNFGHTFGPLHYAKMLERVKQEFGEEYLVKEKKRLNAAALSGVWSWEVYPDAVIYFLKNNPK